MLNTSISNIYGIAASPTAKLNPQNATDCRKEADMSKQKLHILYARLSKDDAEVKLRIKNFL